MDYIERISSTSLELPNNLWENLENINKQNINALITCLQKSVSNGWMGVAAEISDNLEAIGLLDTNPEWRLAIEIERVKRLYDLGFRVATVEACNRTLNYLEQYKGEIERDAFLLHKSTALGHSGWIEDNISKLSLLIQEDENIVAEFKNDKKLQDEGWAFILGLKGRLWFLKKDVKKFESNFREGIELCDKHGFIRSKAHLEIIYAEHLTHIDEKWAWDKAINIAVNFLSNANINQLKTHLLIRAVILMLEAFHNDIITDNKLFKKLAFKYDILTLAMGIGQSKALYPLLAKIESRIPKEHLVDFSNLNIREELTNWLKQANWKEHWESFEELMKVYYEIGYGFEKVVKLPKGFPVFDLVASKTVAGVQHTAAVQTKAYKEKHNMDRSKIPDLNVFREAKNLLRSNHSIDKLSSVHWYITSGISNTADKEIKERVQYFFGESCEVEIKAGVDELVDFLISEPKILARIYFSNEWSNR